jgi:hypothetical protein
MDLARYSRFLGLALVIGCAPAKPLTLDDKRQIADHLFGRCLVVCLQCEGEARQRLESDMVKKMQAQGLDAVEGRSVIPLSDSYSPDDLANFLRVKGIFSIAELTSGSRATPNLPDIKFHWFSKEETHYHSTEAMGLDAALRALIDWKPPPRKPTLWEKVFGGGV